MTPRVVICDDTPAVRQLVRVALTERDIDVVAEATNGVEAVDAATQHQPDVIVLDLAMPVMDGLQAIPLVKAASPATEIVVLTAFDGKVVDAALEAGADAYLAKEDAMHDLADLVLKLAGRSPNS